MFKKNIFGQKIFVKKLIIRLFGSLVYFRFNFRYKTEITGAEVFQKLRDKRVLIVSNHQTYFADVSFLFHVIYASRRGHPNSIRYPGFLFLRKHNIYYVAAEETMKSGFLPRLLALSGAITIKRSWRDAGKNIRRKVDKKETENIDLAIEDGWVITFPQGTTKPYAKGRVGTAIIAKNHDAVIVPVVIDGFRRAFDKKGLRTKKTRTKLRVRVKEPLKIDYSKKVEDIMEEIMFAIEQSSEFDKIEQIKRAKSSENEQEALD